MKQNKAVYFAAIFLIAALFLGCFRFYVFNQGFYKKEFSKLEVYKDVADADRLSQRVIDYFQGGAQLEEFNEREQNHMEDVKSIIDSLIGLFYVSLIFLFGSLFLISRKDIKGLLLTSGITGILMFFAILLLSLNFGVFFDSFHRLFFEAGTWYFYNDDLIINLFPPEFFFDAFFSIIRMFFAASLILVGTGLFLPKNRMVNL